MAGKYFLVDTTRCTACRGCQIACKQWNKLPATPTEQTGSFQNPPELNGETFRLVHFAEHFSEKEGTVWYFFSNACRHCLEPPCKEVADEIVEGAVVVNKDGAVIYTPKTKELKSSFEEIKESCPWGIPTWNDRLGMLTKCHMCHDRVEAGLLPACVKSCPTEALMFGDEAEIKKLAAQRLETAKKKHKDKAQILDESDVRVLYLVVDNYEKKYMMSA